MGAKGPSPCASHWRRVLLCLPASLLAVWCAWMAAMGVNWDGTGNIPATLAFLSVIVMATCPPQVLGVSLIFAVIGYKCHVWIGALWVSFFAMTGLAATLYTWSHVSSTPESLLPSDEELEAGGGTECGSRPKKPLERLWASAAYCMYMPSVFLMNVLWSAPHTVTVVPRFLVLLYFEVVSVVLVSTAGLLAGLCKRVGLGLWHQGGQYQPCSGGTRTPVILVSASGCEMNWIVPRLNLLCQSHLFGPVLVFENRPGEDDGIREQAEKLRDFILESDQLDRDQSVVLIGHSMGGLICAYLTDMLECQNQIQVGSVVCISTPWAGFDDSSGLAGLPRRALGVLCRALGRCGGGKLSRKMLGDMQADSRVLREIQDYQLMPANSVKESRPRFYNLAGSLDPLVANSKHITGKNAFWSCWLPHVGHSSILLSRTMWDQVFAWLKSRSGPSRKLAASSAGHESHHSLAPATALKRGAVHTHAHVHAHTLPHHVQVMHPYSAQSNMHAPSLLSHTTSQAHGAGHERAKEESRVSSFSSSSSGARLAGDAGANVLAGTGSQELTPNQDSFSCLACEAGGDAVAGLEDASGERSRDVDENSVMETVFKTSISGWAHSTRRSTGGCNGGCIGPEAVCGSGKLVLVGEK